MACYSKKFLNPNNFFELAIDTPSPFLVGKIKAPDFVFSKILNILALNYKDEQHDP